MQEEKKEQLITKYLHSELSNSEEIIFSTLIVSDPGFSNEVELKTIFYADRSSDLKIQLEQQMLDMEKYSNFNLSIVSTLSRIAAILVIGFFTKLF